jgi:hypothetical protein
MLKQFCKAFPPEVSVSITQAHHLALFRCVVSSIFDAQTSVLESVVPLFGTIFKPMKFFA